MPDWHILKLIPGLGQGSNAKGGSITQSSSTKGFRRCRNLPAPSSLSLSSSKILSRQITKTQEKLSCLNGLYSSPLNPKEKTEPQMLEPPPQDTLTPHPAIQQTLVKAAGSIQAASSFWLQEGYIGNTEARRPIAHHILSWGWYPETEATSWERRCSLPHEIWGCFPLQR